MQSVILPGTFDGHGHLRRGYNPGQMMHTVIPDVMAEFGGMVVMPNPQPPIINLAEAREYQHEILAAMPPETKFTWVMTCYLTDSTDYDEVMHGIEEGIWGAVKYYPANGSTNTALAVTSLKKMYPFFEKIQNYGIRNGRKKKIPTLWHGETVGDAIDPFDAERIFVQTELVELQRRFPELLIVLEHISTKEAAWYVRDEPYGPVYATITPQHLLYDRKRIFQSGSIANGTFKRGLNPSMVCWPLLKKESDRQALLALIASGCKRVGLGTDRAPHSWQKAKLGDCGAAGCYPWRASLGMYAMAFESVGALEHLPDFACRNIPVGVYELPQGKKTVRLVKDEEHPLVIAESISFDDGKIVPVMHGETISWRIALD